MKIHEECGVFGVMAKEPANVAMMCYYGLYALQHRGQESCGIVVNEDGLFHSHKDLGLVSEVFTGDALSRLPRGSIAVAHARYGTTGATNRRNCQPIEVNHQKGHMAIAHNGNLSNAAALRSELELSGAIFHTTSDTETIAYIITRERLRAPSIEEAVSRAMNTLDGAYSLVIMSPQKLICARDPYGFRPLCYGRTEDGSYVVASESCALAAVGAKFIRDVEPGEILVFTSEGLCSRKEHCESRERRLCIFEYIYFARQNTPCMRRCGRWRTGFRVGCRNRLLAGFGNPLRDRTDQEQIYRTHLHRAGCKGRSGPDQTCTDSRNSGRKASGPD